MTDQTDLSERQRTVKRRFEEQRGFWTELLDDILATDPEFLDLYRQLSAHPWNEGTLSPKLRELLYVTVDCSTTHLYNSGTRLHISNALSHGASFDEVMDVIKLTSTVGLDSVRLGFPLLIAEFVSDAEETGGTTGSDKLEAAVRDRLGIPGETVTLDREFLEIAVEYVETARAGDGLSALEKDFVLIAANASVTHRNEDQVRVHAANAIEHGAQIEEIVEVLEIASVIGSHTITETVPILVEEAAKQDKLPAGIDPP